MKLLLKHCDILVPEGAGFRCLESAYLGIDGGTIDYIGSEKPQAAYDREKDMSGRLLLPGLINCHGHSPMVLLRGVGSVQEWLFGKIMPIEDKLTAEDIKVGNQLALLEMISTGTTSYSDMYFEPQTAVENAVACGIKANISRPVQCFNKDETYGENFRAKESSETKKEHDECVAKYGKTPAKWFYDLGTFDSPTAAAHCVFVTEEDMALMLEKGVSPIHNPTSNMKLGSGFAPIQRMLDLGLNVTLGTDGAASNNNLNMMEELHLAAVLHNGYHRDPTILKPAQLLTMATRSGAKLQGREDTGALEVGKKADIIALDLTKPHMYPNLDPLALTVYSAQGSDVAMTMVDGIILYENGEFLTMDADKILYDAKAVVNRLYA